MVKPKGMVKPQGYIYELTPKDELLNKTIVNLLYKPKNLLKKEAYRIIEENTLYAKETRHGKKLRVNIRRSHGVRNYFW